MICIIDCGSSKVPEIEKMVRNTGHIAAVEKIEDINSNLLAPYEAFIISGAPILLSKVGFLKYENAVSSILIQNKPTLGICFGHQAIALHFDGKVHMSIECREDESIDFISDTDLFKGISSPAIFNQDHCEEASIPLNFTHTAKSKSCNNEGMQHAELPIFGVQFHPETSGDNGQILFNNFLELVKSSHE